MNGSSFILMKKPNLYPLNIKRYKPGMKFETPKRISPQLRISRNTPDFFVEYFDRSPVHIHKTPTSINLKQIVKPLIKEKSAPTLESCS